MIPSVTVIVLNWNGLDVTLECLASLARLDHPVPEVVVVDNGSTDGSAEGVRAQFPKAALIETGENLGFAGGNNVGIRYALERGADHVLLLNNDTVVAPDFLRLLVQAIEADPAAGMAGPMIYFYDQPEVIWSAGGAIDWQRGCTWMVGLDERDEGQYDAVREVDFVTGCALLARREAIEKAGMLDPRFFMYYEETEWCVRTARAGYKILHVPQAHIWHKIAPGAQADSPRVHYYMTRNRLLFLRAAGAGLRAWLHTLIVEYLRTLISWSVRPRWCGRRVQRQVMLRALIDFQQGRFGKVRL